MEYRKVWLLLKRWDDTSNAIQLFRITIVIQSQHEISARLAHHSVTRRHRTQATFIHEHPSVRQLRSHCCNYVLCAAVQSDQRLQWRWIQSLQSTPGAPQIRNASYGGDHHGNSHGQDNVGRDPSWT